ncbi:MAG TPA: hypothetical protein VFV02_06975 [Acidimicrobiales bacterium]|nr:hypothetical protein [Acidimicrobiales bacterium]
MTSRGTERGPHGPTATEMFPAAGGAEDSQSQAPAPAPVAPPSVSPPPPPPAPGFDPVAVHEPAPSGAGKHGRPHQQWHGWAASRQGEGSVLGGRHLVRAAEEHFKDESPWMLGSAALLVALAAYWAGSFLTAFEHAPGLTGQDRVLRILVPGSFVWAAGALLAVALHAAGLKFELAPSEPSPVRDRLPRSLLAATLVSVVAAGLDVLVELANLGHGIDRAVAGLAGYAGVMVLSGAAAWWAYREREAGRRRQPARETA